MRESQILIFTSHNDPHADYVVEILNKKGYPPIRLDTNDIPTQLLLSFEVTSKNLQSAITIKSINQTVDIYNIRSIWWRKPQQYQFPMAFSEQEIAFGAGEVDQALNGLWLHSDCYWISSPNSIRVASWKLGQFKLAKQLGFEIPKTLVTNSPDEVMQFYHTNNRKIIYKVMSDPFLARGKVKSQPNPEPPVGTYTRLISEDDLKVLGSVSTVPCLFQEYIPKKLELRITIIGNKVFPVEIDSQTNEKTKIDWRHYDVKIPFRQATIPDELAEKCLMFTKASNLNFSAIDLILTPDNQYVFLENNPTGQFIFLEKLVPELKMTEALVECLIRGNNG